MCKNSNFIIVLPIATWKNHPQKYFSKIAENFSTAQITPVCLDNENAHSFLNVSYTCYKSLAATKSVKMNSSSLFHFRAVGKGWEGSKVPTNPITITRIFAHWPMEQI